MTITVKEYNAYDIVLGEENKRLIAKYKVFLKREKGDKALYYESFFEDYELADNLEEKIYDLRSNGYFSLFEFNLQEEYKIVCDEVIASFTLALNNREIKPLEYVYHPEIIDGMAHIIGSVVYIDVITGKEYVLKIRDFGLETDNLIKYLETNNYKHINNSSLINHLDKINKPFARELTKK